LFDGLSFFPLVCLWNRHEYNRWYWRELFQERGIHKTKLGAIVITAAADDITVGVFLQW
jgi:hypothetical protein